MWSLIGSLIGMGFVVAWYLCAFTFWYFCGRAQAAEVSFDVKFTALIAVIFFVLATAFLTGFIVWSGAPIAYVVIGVIATVILSVLSLRSGRLSVPQDSQEGF